MITDKITKENAAKLIGSRWPLKQMLQGFSDIQE